MISCTKRLTFSAGHRVFQHEGHCRFLHGHNYAVLLEASSEVVKVKKGYTRPALDGLGRVVDFGVLKRKFGKWIDENWDHSFILFERDRAAIKAVRSINGPDAVFVLPWNPTAENLAIYLMEYVAPVLLRGTDVSIKRVQLWETETAFAEVTR